MSKPKPSSKKKVVVKPQETQPKKPVAAQRSRPAAVTAKGPEDLILKKSNYILMGIGLLLLLVGLFLMTGGEMPNPETWENDSIYGFRQTVLAPALILAGLVIEIFAIFKR